MKKKSIEDILKPGVNIENIKIIDYSDPKQLAKLKKVREQAEQALKNKKVNWGRLSRIYINI